jgi:hypothetical protein
MSAAVETHPEIRAHLAASMAFQAPPPVDPRNVLAETNPPKPTTPTTPAPLLVTRVLAKKPRFLTKSFSLKGNEVKKTSIAQLTQGTAEQISVVGLSGLSDLLESLPSNAALLYGVAAAHPKTEIVREADLAAHPGAITRTRRFFGYRRAPGVLMLDHDADGDTRYSSGELIAILRGLAPCLADVPMLWRASASSGIARTGEIGQLKGQRLYLPVIDAAAIPDGGKALIALLWAAGYGRIMVGAAGQALERTLFDASVWQPRSGSTSPHSR